MTSAKRSFVVGVADMAAALARLGEDGAASLPVLADDYRFWLLEEAGRAPYREARKVVGTGDRAVQQELDYCCEFAADSRFHDLKQRFQALVDAAAARLGRYPFATPLDLGDMMLQRYDPGPIGVTPHRDHARYVNIACLFTLAGESRFGLCDDRSGTGARTVDAAPGTVILLRAPGFDGPRDRPFHFVSDITSERYSFGLRQVRG